MRARFATSAAAAVLAVVAAGGGYALANRTSSGTIHACANKNTGVLRLAKRCDRHEHAITWDKAGVPGQPGATGAPGPSDGYTSTDNFTGPAPGPRSNSLTLPTGNYSVTGQCQASIQTDLSPLEFGLASERLTIGSPDSATPQAIGGPAQASIPNQGFTGTENTHPVQYGAATITDSGLVSLSHSATIYATCEDSGSPDAVGASNIAVDYSDPRIIAIRLGNVHGTTP